MKFNPHLHALSSQHTIFSYKFNREWKQILLQNLCLSSKQHSYGYYVWSDNRILKKKQIAKYVARYVRHPAIANGRIIDYNKKAITFYYKDNEDKEIYITKPTNSFISSLIQHILPNQFNMIRHYGAYSRNQKKKICKNLHSQKPHWLN